MGAWDVGMRSNDSALDAIYVFRDEINKMPQRGAGVLALLKEVAERFKRSNDVTLCVLAVAEALLEQGVKMTGPVKIYIGTWVGRAVMELKEQSWEDPDARLLAIGRFARRVMGEKISAEKDNRSLLEGLKQVMLRSV